MEPDWLRVFKKRNPKADYDSKMFQGSMKRKLRESLLSEQKNICAYCCAEIDIDHSMNEHIEPRKLKNGHKSNKSLYYGNLVASCQGMKGESTCGDHKGNEYNEDMFVSPLDTACEGKFKYYADGVIEGLDDKAKYTIELLNLQSYKLRSARKMIYRQLLDITEGCPPDEMEDLIAQCFDTGEAERLYPFYNVIKWFVQNKVRT